MQVTITVATRLPQSVIECRLAELAGAGPFRVRDLIPLGADRWSFSLLPLRPGLAVGFANVAEVLVRVGREFHVENVERIVVGPAVAFAPLPASFGQPVNT